MAAGSCLCAADTRGNTNTYKLVDVALSKGYKHKMLVLLTGLRSGTAMMAEQVMFMSCCKHFHILLTGTCNHSQNQSRVL